MTTDEIRRELLAIAALAVMPDFYGEVEGEVAEKLRELEGRIALDQAAALSA